ncbi:MAG: hypothetical protein HY537_00530 [Deltaproteobacteria bacterium]|nr:hypothetical protein [Deltaproteobacteria bacterium]
MIRLSSKLPNSKAIGFFSGFESNTVLTISSHGAEEFEKYFDNWLLLPFQRFIERVMTITGNLLPLLLAGSRMLIIIVAETCSYV